MSEKVRENLVSSPQGVDWGLQSTTDLDTATSDQVVSLLKDYCTPENPRDFYNKLEAAIGFPPMSIKYLVWLENFLFFHEKYRVFVSRFRFACIFFTRFIIFFRKTKLLVTTRCNRSHINN